MKKYPDNFNLIQQEIIKNIKEYKQTGNIEARNKAVELFMPDIERITKSMTNTTFHALEDMVSYGVIGFINGIEKFEFTREDSNLFACCYFYIMGNIRNEQNKENRRECRNIPGKRLYHFNIDPQIDDSLIDKSFIEQINFDEMLEPISDLRKAIVQMRILNGYTLIGMSEVLGISITNIRLEYNAAIEQLKRFLTEQS